MSPLACLRRRLGTAGSLAILLACVAGPVSATEPVSYPFAESGSEPIACDGFDATLQRNLSGTVTEFIDGSGATTRVQVVARMEGSLEAAGVGQVDLSGNLLFVINLENGTWAYNGQVLLGTTQGAGVVLQDTGRFLLSFDDDVLLLAGPHDAISKGVIAFCDALG
jgi:hypothetical protein